MAHGELTTAQNAFLAYVTALSKGDDAAAAEQLTILGGAKAPAGSNAPKAKSAKAAKPKRSVEEILSSGKGDGFSTLTAPELKELLKAKKGVCAVSCAQR